MDCYPQYTGCVYRLLRDVLRDCLATLLPIGELGGLSGLSNIDDLWLRQRGFAICLVQIRVGWLMHSLAGID